MARRLIPIAVIVLALFGALWFNSTAFTVTRTVPFSIRAIGDDNPSELRQLSVRCGAEDRYVTGDGSLMFFTDSGPYVPATSWCSGARRDRGRQAALIALGGLLVAVLLALWLQVSHERRASRVAVPARTATASHVT